jgi:hypothetical protein
MSNCANLINRLFSEVCLLKEREAKAGYMLDILQINQSIFLDLDTTIYIYPADATPAAAAITVPTIPGIPLTVTITSYNVTETRCSSVTANSIITLRKISDYPCIVYTTKCLGPYGERNCAGFFCFCKTPTIYVLNIDPSILSEVDSERVYAALQNCAKEFECSDPCIFTLTCVAYDALLAFLGSYGIRTLNVFQAACIYKFFAGIVGNPCNPDCHEPFEPYAPYEPYVPIVGSSSHESSESGSNVFVKQLQDATITEHPSNNESIELKLKALLEATESTEQTD